MQYMIIFDESDKDLIDETLTDKAQRLREDCEARNDALAGRLEALAIARVTEGTPSDADQATDAVRRSREEQGMPLVAQLIQASHQAAADTSQRLIASLQWQVDRLQVMLDLVTSGVHDQCVKPWAPNPYNIIQALYPTASEVDRMTLSRQGARNSAS